jgi:hypothetical protein
LYGQHVGVFKDLIRGVGPVLPFVVLQFVKICKEEGCKVLTFNLPKLKRICMPCFFVFHYLLCLCFIGCVVVRSVKNITRVLFDPALGQLLRLRNG